ncbi:DUF2239 family protein [Azospirillum doebereinerae]|uniref:DUF2239 family protein n=1 Tax=Azospirillum doebereinerae TaxID=92933 RepID=UPI001EE5CC5A|nr:DUF2239 family protein [Azospirillum doebereinerae]MCG5242418.1 DUF2239 family protein [Azospirillum doebereinerae]
MTSTEPTLRCIAFAGHRRIAAGPLAQIARAVKEQDDREGTPAILIFDAATSARVELDLRGTPDEVVARLEPAPAPEPRKAGPGRPKLGVVSREISLLPRHWDWLATQPGGASVTLRKLVEEARRAGQEKDRARDAQNAAQRFLTAMAGDLPNYEEATRAFYANDAARFTALIAAWPADVRDHAAELAAAAMGNAGDATR